MTWEYTDTPSYLLKARKTTCVQKWNNSSMARSKTMEFTPSGIFHLFEITLHRKKEYDEHSLITNYSHSHITSQYEFSLPTA